MVSPIKITRNGKMVNEFIAPDNILDLITMDTIKKEIGIKINTFNKEKYNINVTPIEQSISPI